MNAKTAAIEKFEKGSFYETKDGNVFWCANGRQRKAADGNMVIDMKAVKDGKPFGRAEEEYADRFVAKLSKAEMKEREEIDRREAEAIADAESEGKRPRAKKVKGTKAKVAAVKQPGGKKKGGRKPAAKTSGKMSAIDAAARVLQETGEPMRCKELIEQMAAKRYWTSPGGKTPHATLYSAILREIQVKGKESRFKKMERGLFAYAG